MIANGIVGWNITTQDTNGNFGIGNVDEEISLKSFTYKTTLETHHEINSNKGIVIDYVGKVSVILMNRIQKN